jgi:hypothetical protein
MPDSARLCLALDCCTLHADSLSIFPWIRSKALTLGLLFTLNVKL